MPLWKPPIYPVVSGASPLTTTSGDNNGLSPGITYASPLLPFYTNGGSAPVVIPSILNVSTLNAKDSITVGGVGQTLTGASGELLINGKPLATVSTVSSLITLNNSNISTLITDTTAKWATYPALSTLQMNGNKMLSVSSISGVAGQTLPILAETVSFGTLGQLTGVSSLNGVVPSSDWANYSAVQDLNLNSKNLNSANQLNLNTGGNAVMLTAGAGNNLLINGNPITPPAPTNQSTITGQNTYMLATGGTLASANSIITAGGGTGGNITATANAGDLGVSGGNISLTANGGVGLGGLYGVVNLTANPGTDLVSGVNTGGAINILANSPTLGLTSKVSITGGGVNIYSGIFTPLASVFGYTFINASLGISLVSGGFSPFPQSPGTTYIYGAQGIILDNGVYATDIQPIWDGNPLVPPAPLRIHGRTAGGSNVPVLLENVGSIQMQGSGSISGVNSINGSAYPPVATVPPDLLVSTITFNPLNGNISSLNGINNGLFFTDTGDKMNFIPVSGNFVGQIEGLSTLNVGLGISPLGDKITFAPTVDAGLQGQIVGVSTINGSAYPPAPTPLSPDANFSTITIGTGGNISFSDATGFLRTTVIYGRAGDALTIEPASGQPLELVGSGTVGLAESFISLNSDGSIVMNNDVPDDAPITDGTGIVISPEGQSITFPQNPAGTVGVGAIVNLSTINGVAYPPTGGSYPANANFSTITVGTDGNITFADSTGFLKTTSIVGRDEDDLDIDASEGNVLTLSGGAIPTAGNSVITLNTNGSVVINDNIGAIPITNGDGLVISREGYSLTFPLSLGDYPYGEIHNLFSINGDPYIPLTSNPQFSTITTASAGSGTGFIQTSLLVSKPSSDLNINSAIGNSLLLNGGALLGGINSKVELSTDGSISFNSVSGTVADGTGITISPEATTLTFPKDILSAFGVGAIENLSSINGVAYPPVATLPADPSFSTITVASAGNITFSGAGGDIVGVNNLAVNSDLQIGATTTISLSGLFGSPGDVIGIPIGGTYPAWITPSGGSYPADPSFSTITLASAGTITLEASVGSPGQYIGIPVDGTTPAWVDAPAPKDTVETLNGCSGTVSLVAGTGIGITPDTGAGTITIEATGATTAGVSSLQTLTGDITFTSTGDTIAITTDGTTINLETTGGGSGGVPSVNTITTAVSIVAGTNITITDDVGAGTITIDATATTGVSALNGLTGAVDIVSPDSSIFVNAVDAQVNLTLNRDVPVSVIVPTGTPEVIVPVSGTFYAIDANATSATVSFDMSGFPAGTTFTVKNISSTNDNLNIEFDDSTGSVPATGVNLPLLHADNSRNSVMCMCYWNGTTLTVY